MGQAQGLQQQDVENDFRERQFAESQRQFNEQLAAQRRAQAAAMAMPTFGGAKGGQTAGASASQKQPTQGSYGLKNSQDGAGGFWFTDAGGRSVSAAQFASMNGIELTDLLNRMASAGDTYAASALRAIPSVMANGAIPAAVRAKYGAIFGGTPDPARGGGW